MRVATLLLVSVLVGGCGFRGPLYLPQPTAAAPKPAIAKPEPSSEHPAPAENPVVPQ
jgi:predicted small lipoprotein YifL